MIFNKVFIKLLNNILSYNQGSLNILKKNSNKTFKLIFPALNFNLCARIDIDGYLIDTEEYETKIIFPSSLLSYLVDKDKIAAYKLISITGDRSFARNIIEVFSNLSFINLDHSESLSKIFLIHVLNKFLQTLHSIYKLVEDNAQTSILEYYLYETGDIVNKNEIEVFCNEVDNLNDDINRLEVKLNLYLKVDN